MAPRCERCEKELDGKTGGVRARLGLKTYEGFECPQCGALLCDDCHRERRRELAGSAHDSCPVCAGILQHR